MNVYFEHDDRFYNYDSFGSFMYGNDYQLLNSRKDYENPLTMSSHKDPHYVKKIILWRLDNLRSWRRKTSCFFSAGLLYFIHSQPHPRT